MSQWKHCRSLHASPSRESGFKLACSISYIHAPTPTCCLDEIMAASIYITFNIDIWWRKQSPINQSLRLLSTSLAYNLPISFLIALYFPKTPKVHVMSDKLIPHQEHVRLEENIFQTCTTTGTSIKTCQLFSMELSRVTHQGGH